MLYAFPRCWKCSVNYRCYKRKWRYPRKNRRPKKQAIPLPTCRFLIQTVITKALPIQTIKTWMYPHPLPLNFKTKHSGKRYLHSAMPFLYESYCAAGGLTFVSRTKSMLTHMGFPKDTWEKSVETLSGGQKTRLALIRLLLEEPDILLLDEPTNHLDMETTEWLEKYLKTYPKALIVISHDRYFLDEVTNITLHIFDGVGKQYDNCNYSAFAKRLEKDRAVQTKHYLNQQKRFVARRRTLQNSDSGIANEISLPQKADKKHWIAWKKLIVPKTIRARCKYTFSQHKPAATT